ncbi:S-layer homology domain-containing protein [Paenibacillus sp. y28]|uniref:S-layer homology domain-containing protein n=1 Tax=Paenibacillus sp. y28 TaxID=3129110 RepID=UPI00301AE3C4
MHKIRYSLLLGMAVAIAAGPLSAFAGQTESLSVSLQSPGGQTYATGEVPVNIPLQLKAVAISDSGESRDVTAETVFSSSNTSAVAIHSAGSVTVSSLTGLPGVIKAVYDGVSTERTLDSASPDSLTFTIADLTMDPGIVIPFTLTGKYGADQADFTQLARYETSDAAIATVTADGIVGHRAGSVTITAIAGETEASVKLFVTNGLEDPYWGVDKQTVLRQQEKGIAYLNEIRQDAGLNRLAENESLNWSAQAHSKYLASNPNGDLYTEQAGKTNFFGADIGHRAAMFGYDYEFITEAVLPVGSSAETAVQRMIDSPYQRIKLLDRQVAEVGIGIQPGGTPWTVIDLGDRSNLVVHANKPVMYPYDGQKGVPASWNGNGAFAPLKAYGKEAADVGYPISISVAAESTLHNIQAAIRSGSGKSIPFYDTDGEKDGVAGRNYVVLIPQEPLEPSTTYIIDVKGEAVDEDGNKVYLDEAWSFTTASSKTASDGTGAASPNPGTTDGGSGTAAGPAADRFTDVKGHWAEETLSWAADQGIVEGYEDGILRPDQTVSEAEIVILFLRSYGLLGVQDNTGSSGHWSDSSYRAAAALNMPVLGASDAAIRDGAVLRGTVAEIIAGADGQHLNGDDAIHYLLAKGYSNGKTDRSVSGYRGADVLTRAEALQFIRNLKSQLVQWQARPVEPTSADRLPPLE